MLLKTMDFAISSLLALTQLQQKRSNEYAHDILRINDLACIIFTHAYDISFEHEYHFKKDQQLFWIWKVVQPCNWKFNTACHYICVNICISKLVLKHNLIKIGYLLIRQWNYVSFCVAKCLSLVFWTKNSPWQPHFVWFGPLNAQTNDLCSGAFFDNVLTPDLGMIFTQIFNDFGYVLRTNIGVLSIHCRNKISSGFRVCFWNDSGKIL